MILCLHGFAQTPESWLGLVSPGAAATAPALPGHAGEPPPASFDETVEALAARIEGRCRLAGYSLGARLALALCLRHADRVADALLVGVSPGIEDEAERRRRRGWDDDQAALLERDGLERFVERWEMLPLFSTQTPEMRAAQRAARRGHQAAGLAAAMRHLGQGRMPSLWAGLPSCEVPLRLMVGSEDHKYLALAERVAKLTPTSTVEIVPGKGHNLLVEAPEAVRRALLQGAT